MENLLFFFVMLFPVKMHEVIHANTMGAGNKTIHRDITLQGPGSANPNDPEAGKVFFYMPAFEVDINQCVQFIQHNINIIGPYSG